MAFKSSSFDFKYIASTTPICAKLTMQPMAMIASGCPSNRFMKENEVSALWMPKRTIT